MPASREMKYAPNNVIRGSRIQHVWRHRNGGSNNHIALVIPGVAILKKKLLVCMLLIIYTTIYLNSNVYYIIVPPIPTITSAMDSYCTDQIQISYAYHRAISTELPIYLVNLFHSPNFVFLNLRSNISKHAFLSPQFAQKYAIKSLSL